MDNKYTTSDIATTLKVSLRTAQRYIENLINKEDGKIFIDEDVFNLLISRHSNDTIFNKENDEMLVEYFTAEEYEEFKKRLTEYPLLKERINEILKEVEYHRKSAESHNKQMEILLQTIQQRNFIEASEKLLDKK